MWIGRERPEDVADVWGSDMVEVVDISSSGSRSDGASYRFDVVVELALQDRCI